MTSRIVEAGASPSLATAPAVAIVPQVPWEWTFARGVVAPPSREPISYPATTLSTRRGPSSPCSSATARAPGMTWIAGWPPPRRLPSSTSSATPAVAFVSAAQEASALAPCPTSVAVPRGARPAAHRPALVGREPGDGEVVRLLDRPFGIRVPDREIGVGAGSDHAFLRVETEDARRILREHACEPRDGESPLDDALAVGERHESLERRRAEGDRLALGVHEDVRPPRFLGRRDARRVIARDGGDGARGRALPERGAVRALSRPERRADLGEGPPALHLLVGEQQILRTRLRPDLLALGLSALDALETHLRREVHDVDGAPGEPRDEDGAIDRLLLGPVGAGRWEVGGRRAPLGDRLVLEVAQDVAVLAVELADAAQRGETLHGLGDELV